MSELAQKKATYQDLFNIPENMTGQIINGELELTPKPSPMHANAASALAGNLWPPYRFGRGGPGGWVFLPEMEIMFAEHLLVPDISGWRKERFPGNPKENWFSVTPDWVCEILSPSTARLDRVKKMPIYAQHKVGHIWLIHSVEKTLEVYRLAENTWSLLASFGENDKVRAEPFQEIEIDLTDFWLE